MLWLQANRTLSAARQQHQHSQAVAQGIDQMPECNAVYSWLTVNMWVKMWSWPHIMAKHEQRNTLASVPACTLRCHPIKVEPQHRPHHVWAEGAPAVAH